MTGNYMIDADPGLDPASPYYDRNEDIIEVDKCYWCSDEYPADLFEHWTEGGHPICQNCIDNAEEGDDLTREQLVCDVCGSTDVIEAPHMGRNCNRCHPL